MSGSRMRRCVHMSPVCYIRTKLEGEQGAPTCAMVPASSVCWWMVRLVYGLYNLYSRGAGRAVRMMRARILYSYTYRALYT